MLRMLEAKLHEAGETHGDSTADPKLILNDFLQWVGLGGLLDCG